MQGLHPPPRVISRHGEPEASMRQADLIGYVAASLVFATFCAKRMVPLRVSAIASNVGFISYGSLLGLWPIVLLHAVMLPVNVVRLCQALAMPGRPGWLVRWRERERHRRELATMRACDFGDLAVPPGLIEDEKRRWPWQAWSAAWSGIVGPRHGGADQQTSAIPATAIAEYCPARPRRFGGNAAAE
jgi:uncharacterized protein YjiS (DUF1127 family)